MVENKARTMNTNRQIRRLWWPALLAVVFCCQCKTTEEEPDVITSLEGGSKFGKFGKVKKVGYKRQGGYEFAGGGEKEGESAERVKKTGRNEKEIKNRKGEVVRTEKRADLYGDRSSNTARETSSGFKGNKAARFKKDSFAGSEFRTPEYLKRQQYNGTKDYRDGSQKSREDGTESKLADRLFKTKAASDDNQLARESGSNSRQDDKTFRTSADRTGTKALSESKVPEGVPQSGYRENAMMSMDDVKKMVNPSSYRPES